MNLSRSARAIPLLLLAGACGGGDDDGGGEPDEVETLAPRCDEVAGGDPRELLTHAVVPTESVFETLIFGGMDPGTLEPINFELGYRLDGINVPVTAPADLYVRSFEYTSYLTGSRAGETDYAVSFTICSDAEGAPAVEGDFAHITALEPDFADIIATATFDCYDNEGPEETIETCRVFYPADADDGLVIPVGTAIGSAGGTGNTDYAPGFDFNLLDTRYPNEYVNPDRIGAEEGPGRWFRYGACVYEYFAEPMRSAYLDVVGQNGDLRVSADDPCGTMSIDMDGTAAGVWILAGAAELDISTDLVGVLENLLVLGPHHVFPGTREVISSEMLEVASWQDGGLLVEFEPEADAASNPSFYDMEPGTIHCLDAAGFGNEVPHHYYVELGDGGDTLTLERLEASCSLVEPEARAFTGAALEFVR
jgi:hypothetical protein